MVGKEKLNPDGFSKSHCRRERVEFPVDRIHRFLIKGNETKRVSTGAAVYLAAVLESVVADVIALAGENVRDKKYKEIKEKDLPFSSRIS